MGQAKIRAKEIEQLKSKPAVVIAPLYPDHSTDNMKVGDWMRKENIEHHDAWVVGRAFSTLAGEVKVSLLITRSMNEDQARKTTETWWALPENKGPKFAAWIPLNDIREMTVSGMDRYGNGVQGQTLAMTLEMAGFKDQFAQALTDTYFKDPEFKGAMDNMGFSDIFVA